jgi:Zn-dependent peptidase ImmA (M78 family)/DNA-binding XRE family transcriptional regulator
MEKTANPSMITLARESRGMSQTKLATKLSVSQAAVSKLESGQIKAEGELLTRLSAILEYPEAFFCRPFKLYPAGMQFYRKHKTLPVGMGRKIEALLNLYRHHVSQLLLAAELQFLQIPECDIDDYGDARKVARYVRQYLQLPRGPIMDLTAVLESMGIIVIPFDPGTRLFSGVSTIVNTDTQVILINSAMPGDRYRWTLAHEFGHIVMHRLPSDDMEAEADAFAGELLMPSDQIKPHLRNLSIAQLASLKRVWRVSMNGILTNGQKIKAISEWSARLLRMNMAKKGITRLQEPPALDFPQETPSILSDLLSFHLDEAGFSFEDLSSLLGLFMPEFMRLYNLSTSGEAPRIRPKNKLRLSIVR